MKLTYGKGALGEACWMWMQSSLHCHWPVRIMQASVIPAFQNSQYYIFKDGNEIVGYVSWAFFDEETEVKYIAKPHSLDTDEWRNGNRLWFPDFIAKDGYARSMVHILRTEVFPNNIARSLRVKKDSTHGRIITYQGVNMIGRVKECLQPINFDKSDVLRPAEDTLSNLG
ncbi:toxin-activating lysine-acyltransferase [Enterovibrio norvegicus]|uniref:toxin-activating lysine-acyltransferase n=1 Tax=Enterovibrio norvegicus TaxID=188144 RepID=UPI00354F966C